MLSITPVRERISERFPVASFVVNVPPDRYFEIACATDPRLFRGDHAHRRTVANFATSRAGGLLRAPAGQATYIIPPSQLRRFAGAPRLYYALGSYAGARNESPVMTLAMDRVERAPSIQIAPDFTGRSLDRGRIGQADARYGAPAAPLVWGGDDLGTRPASGARLGNPTGAAMQSDDDPPYDDGFDAALWTEAQHDPDADNDDDTDGNDLDVDAMMTGDQDEGGEAYGSRGKRKRGKRGKRGAGEPAGYEDAVEAARYREPDGYEDGAALGRASYGGARLGGAALGEPDGHEDLPARDRAYGGRRADRQVAGPASAPAPMPMPMSMPAPAPVYASAPAPARYGNAGGATHHERYGSVRAHAPQHAPTYAPQPVYGDPAGFEDLPDLVRNLGPRHRRSYGNAYGNGADAVPAPTDPVNDLKARLDSRPSQIGYDFKTSASAAIAPPFPDFSDDVGVAEALPDTAPALDPDAAFAPSDPRHRLRILARAAQAESGSERYRAVGIEPATGLAWGYVQLAQKHGGLGHALRVCLRRDRDAYVRIFGERNAAPAGDDLDLTALPADNLLRVTCAADPMARLAPVVPPTGGPAVPLWQAPWLDVFRAAGDVQAFQEAQREVADRRYYLPFTDFLRWLGIRSVLGHTMFVDRAIQMGGGAAARWFARTAGPIRSQADLRAVLAHLGFADLTAFQAARSVPGVTIPAADGVFGALTHAALAAALRHAVDSPVPMRTEPEMLQALLDDADRQAESAPHWQIAAQRLHELADDSELVHVPSEAAR